ncbi:MAG TPA: family 78 glycoside hydrolase catalytic domain [Puia sp.]|nr:family 78 glycoside hydrolase catalytic domain [Puia sp.]
MIQKIAVGLIFSLTLAVLHGHGQTLKTNHLTCEYLVNPLGIDIAKPALSWQLVSEQRDQQQSAYTIIVSDNRADIDHLHGNTWTSGKKSSSRNTNIIYAGPALHSFKRYYWRVQAYDRNGVASPWSDPAWFETSMLQPGDWQARWITDGRQLPVKEEDFYQDDPAPLFRKDFRTKGRPVSARLYISGLGYYEAYLNGEKIGDHLLDPGWTTYEKTVLYTVYDITDKIRDGDNAAGIMLGNGWFNTLPLRMWGGLNIRKALYQAAPGVRAQLQLTYADGKTEVIATDESWQTATGPVIRNSQYLGEQYDARLEQPTWAQPGGQFAASKDAVVSQGPPGALIAQIQPAIKVTEVIKPISVTEPKEGVFLFDMGQNFAGVAQINLRAPAGTLITLRYGEEKYKDGNIDVMTGVAGQIKSGNGGPGSPKVAWQQDSYIAKGQGQEVWSPRFTFHGFRYVEVTGWPGKPDLDAIRGLRMNAAVEDAGSFSCSNPMLNKLDTILKRTFKSNIFSVQSDCPAREKFGYGGDLFCTSEAFSFHFDMANFYRKVIHDYADAQRPNGGITETAPFVGIGDNGIGNNTGPISFQLVFPYVIKQLYDFYGDRRVIEQYYPALEKQVRLLQDSAKDNLYFIDLSDHESLTPKSVALTGSVAYYHHVRLMALFAGILDKKEEQKKYDRLAGAIRQSILDKFVDTNTGKADNGKQTAQVYALWDGLAADRGGAVFNKLLSAIDSANGHLSTGIFATKMLFDVLRDHDRNEVAYGIVNKRSFPGWGYMIDNGATTLWETWAYSDNTFSQNHPMFGSVGEWMYRSLLGINAGAPGFEKIIIKPQPAGDLTYARGSYLSVKGPIVSSWKKEAGRFDLQVEIPANTTGEIWLPAGKDDMITESGMTLSHASGIKLLRRENGYAVIATGSGKFDFSVSAGSPAQTGDSPAQSGSLLKSFITPPDSVKPGCYWYWVTDNISREGVVKDIEAMSEVGIGRAFIGNVGFGHHGMGLDEGPAKLFSDQWWDVTQAAMSAGVRNKVDIGLFNGPGWSQSGGPWVKPSGSMRYLDAQEISVEGPRKISQKLNASPLFQDVAILAFPSPASDDDVITRHTPQISSNIDSFDVQKAFDGDTLTDAVLPPSVNAHSVVNIDIRTAQPYTTRSLSLYPVKRGMTAHVVLQVYEQDSFRTIKIFDYDRSNPALNVGFKPWAPVVISFPEITATRYRLVVTNIHGGGGFAEIQLSGAARIERYSEKQLAKMFQTPQPMWKDYQWPAQAESSDPKTLIDPSAGIDLSRYLAADGTLSWDVPAGKWIIMRFGMMPTGVTNSPATTEGTGYEIDKLSRQAAEDHFSAFVGKIQQRIPAADRKSLKYLVADSYETGSQNWTDDFAASFQRQYKYDPLPWLPVFSGRIVGSADRSDRFLWDVRRLVADKVAYDYVGGLRRIGNQHGLKLWLENYGHWGYPSEFLKYGGQSDEVAGEFWAEGELGSIECRDASSSAHIYGKSSVSAESFTSAGNAYGRYPGSLKRRGDWSFTEGINNTIFHVYIEQPYEDKMPGVNAWFGTEFNRHNTWFKKGKAFIDYIRRCNFMLQQGKPVNDVAYFIGEDAPKMTGIRDPALPAGYQFDYINAEVIEQRLSVKDGRLVLPDGMSYRLLVLPALETMRPELLTKIAQLVQDGAVVLGPPPQRSPSMQNYPVADKEVRDLSARLWAGVDGKQHTMARVGKGYIINGMTMEQAMDTLNTIPDFKSNTPSPILYTHRSVAGEEVYFISNQSDTVVTLTPSFRITKGQPQWWDAVTGETRRLPVFQQQEKSMDLPLKLEAYQSCFIVFSEDQAPGASAAANNANAVQVAAGSNPAAKTNFPAPVILQTLSRPWIVTFDTAMRGPLAPVVFNQLDDWSRRPEDSIKNYSGTATYKTTFRVAALPKDGDLYIDLGSVKVMATVRLNGKDLGTAWTAPWRVKATGALRIGENRLEIEVVNTWINRLIGDSKLPPAERKTWTNVNDYKPGNAYDPSGLTGPVTISISPNERSFSDIFP